MFVAGGGSSYVIDSATNAQWDSEPPTVRPDSNGCRLPARELPRASLEIMWVLG